MNARGNIGTNGTIGYRETFRVLWLPMVPLVTNGTIGKIGMVSLGESRTHAMFYSKNTKRMYNPVDPIFTI